MNVVRNVLMKCRPAPWLAGLLAALLLATAARADGPAVCGAAIDVPTERRAPLVAFAEQLGLKQVDAFVGTVTAVRRTGPVPGWSSPTRRAARGTSG
jgi:hypothetical protein